MSGPWAQRLAAAVERPSAAYTLTAAVLAGCVALRVLIGQAAPDASPYLVFYPAVLVATVLTGARGGLLAVLVSAVTVLALWAPQGDAAGLAQRPGAELALFVVTAAGCVGLARAFRSLLLRGLRAEARFREAQDAALDGFAILDPVREGEAVVDFVWSYANPAADRMAPPGLRTFVGRRVLEVYPNEWGRAMVERLKGRLALDAPDDIEIPGSGVEGGPRWLRSSGVRLEEGVAVTFRDITEEKRARETLQVGEARVRALVAALPQLIWAAQPDGGRDYLSPQWVRFTGQPREKHLGFGYLEAIHPDDLAHVTQAWRTAAASGRPFEAEYRIRRHDGVWRWFSSRAAPLFDPRGNAWRWVGASTDITEIVEARRGLEDRVAERTRELEASLGERARAEAELAQVQRLETVGRLTGGVAHDFNNLLTVVIGGLDLILRDPANVPRVVRLAEAALAAGRRGERLTRQLLAFARRQELNPEAVDVPQFIHQIEPLIRRAVGEALEFVMECDPGAGVTRLDPAQFEAAVLNLVVNAADATPPGGRIKVEVSRRILGEGEVPGAAPGDHIVLRVSDTGVGMTPEVRERVFEPFYTTKDPGKGTGLGLAQVYGFVTQCGGMVTIDSAPGAGAAITLYLPASRPEATEADASEAAHDLPRLGWRVLLVEDEGGVREVAQALLADLGCSVVSVGDAAAALAALDAGERFDVVVTDIVMPGGMSGVDLARRLKAERPDLPVVLATGYAGGAIDPGVQMSWPLLRKPFQAEQLVAALREAADIRD